MHVLHSDIFHHIMRFAPNLPGKCAAIQMQAKTGSAKSEGFPAVNAGNPCNKNILRTYKR